MCGKSKKEVNVLCCCCEFFGHFAVDYVADMVLFRFGFVMCACRVFGFVYPERTSVNHSKSYQVQFVP